MITAEIMGGLGNQLFIIFTLIAYSLDKKNSFYFEDKEIEAGERKVVYWDNLLQHLAKFIKPVQFVNAVIREKNLNYNKLPKIETKITAKLNGYFQSFKYFDKRKEDILKFIKLSEIIEPYRNLYDYENSISLHFRLGDYKFLQGYHPIMNIDYYKRSLQTMMDKTEITNWQVLYFCEDEDVEDIELKIEQLQIEFPSLSFLRANNMLSDWEQMLVMSLCAHNIVANSSFSWWAAYLNSNNNMVCCPDIIIGPEIKTTINLEDRYPSTWTIIEA